MNKLLKYITISAGCLSILSNTGCKNALEEEVFSAITPVNFYKTEGDAKAAVNSVYGELYTHDLYMQPFWNLTLLDDDHVSGSDWYLGAAGSGNPQNYWGVSRPWVGCYTMIARANTVLENVSKMTGINEVIKNRVLGEAHFLRGWAYFQLVQLYGEVPIRLKSLTADPNADVPKSSVKEVYDVVIADFKAAEANLLPPGHASVGETGRVNKAVAQAFLAKAYLTMASGSASNVTIMVKGGNDNIAYPHTKEVVAGYESFNSRDYFDLARQKSLEVIETYKNTYPLFQNWVDVWKKDNRNKGEHMWMLQSLAGTNFTNDLHSYFSARSLFGIGAVWMTNNHYNNYADQDERVLHGVTHNYQANWGTYYFYPKRDAAKYETVNGVFHNNDGNADEKAFVIKYSDVSNPDLGSSDAFFPLLRFPEVLLMYAEAENEINGPTTEAYKALNEVRSRSEAGNAPVGMPKNGFRDFVLEERGREFALENAIRHFDLKRWGIYLSVMNKITTPQNNINKQRSRRNLLLPVPPEEMNTNKAITENNFGW